MNLDRIVVTTFPGYFFATVLCINAIKQYLPSTPIDVIIDDFDLQHWPEYVEDTKSYLSNQCNIDLNFYKFSDLPNVDASKTGGWFRQQFIKLYLDQLVGGDQWLVVDGDLIFKETPKYQQIPLIRRNPPHEIDIGNRKYVEYFLSTNHPYIGDNVNEYWCASSVPFRYLTRDLLVNLRRHVEVIHNQDFLSLHTDLLRQQKLVAFAPNGETMVMSEFQLIELYRYLYTNSMPFIYGSGGSKFYHDSIKDWNKDPSWFIEQGMTIDYNYWKKIIVFGQHAI